MRLRKRNGFTLGELLTAVAIIALLAVIVVFGGHGGCGRNVSTPDAPVPSSSDTAIVDCSVQTLQFDYDKENGEINIQVEVAPPLLWGQWVSNSKLQQLAKQELEKQITAWKAKHPGSKVRRTGYDTAKATNWLRGTESGTRMTVIEAMYSVEFVEMVASSEAPSHRKITVAVRDDYGVFSDYENGEWSGAAPFFARLIGKKRKAEVVFQRFDTPDQCVNAVRTGMADLAIGLISITPERQEHVDFSKTYLETGVVIATMDAQVAKNVVLANDVTGSFEILVGRGTTAASHVQKNFPDAVLRETSNSQVAYGLAQSMVIDVRASGSKMEARILVAADETIVSLWPEAIMMELDGQTLRTSENYGVAVKKDNQVLLDAVNQVIVNQEITNMYEGFVGR